MRFFRYVLPIVAAVCGYLPALFASDHCCQQANGVTPVLLREYINSKRTIPLEEKDCNLSISGDVRTIWAHVSEQIRGQKLRGRGATTMCSLDETICSPFSANDFDIIFDLYFDYACDRSWGVAWLQFDNPCGLERLSNKTCARDPEAEWGSGRCNGLCLRKAYWGYNLVADGYNRFDIEVGRRPLYTVFDSYLQFRSRFDGVLIRYAAALPYIADFYLNMGGFIIDEKANHFGYVGEFGLLNIGEFGWDAKYSLINWNLNGRNRCGIHHPDGSKYLISQWTVAFNLDPDWFCKPVSVFGAYLYNHSAERNVRVIIDPTRHNSKKNQAWYAGITIGDVCRAGDWAAQILYIQSEAQAVPDFDVYYIGRGNVLCENFTQGTLPENARGNSNFQGWRFEFLYAFTASFSLDTFLEFSRPEDERIGGKHRYSRFQVEGIYAF